MKLALAARRPARPPAEPAGPATSPAATSSLRLPRWTAGEALTAAGTRLLIWVLVACGPAALVAWMTTRPGSAAPAQVASTDDTPARQTVSEAAEAGVVAWLTTPQSRAGDLHRWFPAAGDDVQLPDTASAAEHVTAAAAVPASSQPGVWSVVVGADVTDPGQKISSRRYFQVAVAATVAAADRSNDPAQVTLLSLPAPVAGPVFGSWNTAAYNQQLSPDGPIGQTVASFTAALTAGQGDITRLISPGALIRPIQPPLASQVRLTALAATAPITDPALTAAPDGQQIHVLATTDLIAASGQARTSQYAITLTGRAGRWEVSQLDPAPAAPDTSATALMSSPAPAGTTTAPSTASTGTQETP